MLTDLSIDSPRTVLFPLLSIPSGSALKFFRYSSGARTSLLVLKSTVKSAYKVKLEEVVCEIVATSPESFIRVIREIHVFF